jgi:CelD/BcsL family acetyltransferase involved in cellulose biosynthesis
MLYADAARMRREVSVEDIRDLWERLAAAQPIGDVMASPLGWEAWHRAHSDSARRIVIAREHGVPVALLVIARAPASSWKRLFARRYVSAGDLHWQCRYPITGPDVDHDMRVLFEQLAREGGWDELVLGPILANSPTRHALEVAGHALGMYPVVTNAGRAQRIVIRGTWTDFYASRSPKLRADVSHGERRLGKLGPLAIEQVRGGRDLDAALAEFFRVEATGWKLRERTAIACDPDLQKRYVALARDAAARGRFRTFLLRAGGQVVAANYCIEHEGDLYQLKTGYDAEHGKASPGHVLHKRVLETLFERADCNSLDFMTGGGEHGDYKDRWANDVREYAEIRLFRPRRPRGQALAQLVRFKRAIADARVSQ